MNGLDTQQYHQQMVIKLVTILTVVRNKQRFWYGYLRLNGSGNYQTRFVNANDYRAQEFPNGTLTTINTYYLTIKVLT